MRIDFMKRRGFLILLFLCISLTSCGTGQRRLSDIPAETRMETSVETSENHVEKPASAVPDFSSGKFRGIRTKIADYMEEFRKNCRGVATGDDRAITKIKIETRLLDVSTEGGDITKYEDSEGRIYRYRLVIFGEMGQEESNYYLLDEFTYYTSVRKEYGAPLDYTWEEDISREISTEGIMTLDGCCRYDREQDQVLESEPLDLAYTLEELRELFEKGEEMPPESYGGYEVTERALDSYREFLASSEMYSLTATGRYPRGDSHAVYGFSDCNGDGVPELHLDGGDSYRIYTFRGDEILFYMDFEHGSPYPSITPLKDGGFVGNGWKCKEIDGDMASYRRIQPWDGIPADQAGETCSYFEFYFRISPGGIVERGEPPVSCALLLEDESLHLPLTPLFPEEERAYLDAVGEGNGSQNPLDGSEEWKAYERILSGYFSSIHDIRSRSHLTSVYDASLSGDTGRSCWKYLLMDLNGDGIRDLFIRCRPEEDDYTTADIGQASRGIACFSYADGVMDWWDFDVSHERYVPLKDGRMLFMDFYGVTAHTMIGRFDSDFNFQEEKTYRRLIVEYDDYHDREWYEKYFSSGLEEGEYYFTQEADGGKFKTMTEEEWRAWNDEVEKLLIPDSEWEPASVFFPNRYREEFYVG